MVNVITYLEASFLVLPPSQILAQLGSLQFQDLGQTSSNKLVWKKLKKQAFFEKEK